MIRQNLRVTTALARLQTQMTDVDALISLHPNRQPTVSVSGAGRPAGNQGPLLRSCVLLAYAAWEVYAEESALAAATSVAEGATREQLPESLKTFVTTNLGGDPWVLAGEGWRRVLVDQVTLRVRGDEGNDHGEFGINTAGPRQVAALHQELFGKRLINDCAWRNANNAWVKAELNKLVKVRGSIAHKGTALGSLNLDGVESWRSYVVKLAEVLDGKIDAWVAETLTA